MQNGNGKQHRHRIDLSRPAKARRATKRALADFAVSTQVESLGGAMDDAHSATRNLISERLDAIDARLSRLEKRLLGVGLIAFAVAEGLRPLLHDALRSVFE